MPQAELTVFGSAHARDTLTGNLPIRILGVDGNPLYYSATCTNLSRGGIAFETTVRLEVGKVIEFEFVQVVDEPVRYWVRILFRDNTRYGGYYVNDDGSDIRPTN